MQTWYYTMQAIQVQSRPNGGTMEEHIGDNKVPKKQFDCLASLGVFFTFDLYSIFLFPLCHLMHAGMKSFFWLDKTFILYYLLTSKEQPAQHSVEIYMN